MNNGSHKLAVARGCRAGKEDRCARARTTGGDIITDDICEFHAAVCGREGEIPDVVVVDATRERERCGRPLRDAPINLGGR